MKKVLTLITVALVAIAAVAALGSKDKSTRNLSQTLLPETILRHDNADVSVKSNSEQVQRRGQGGIETWYAVSEKAEAGTIIASGGTVTEVAWFSGATVRLAGATEWTVKSTDFSEWTGADGVYYPLGYIQGGTNGMAKGVLHSTGVSSHIQVTAEKAGTVYIAAKYSNNKPIWAARVPSQDVETIDLSDLSSYLYTYEGKYIKDDGTYGGDEPAMETQYAALPLEVEPGYTYFFWVSGSKIMLCGVSYVLGDAVWTVAGSQTVFGTEWDPTDFRNDMVQTKDGVFELVKYNVTLEAGSEYEYKIVCNHSWDINYGADGMQDGANITFSVEQSGTYNVRILFYPETHLSEWILENATISYDLVTLPEGAEVQDWAMGSLGANNDSKTAKVAIVGNEMYLEMFSAYYPECWIKGTIDGNTVTFPSLQYVGTYRDSYNMWVVGFDYVNGYLPSFTMTYDAEAGSLLLNDKQMVALNADPTKLYYLSYYTRALISKDQTFAANYEALLAAIVEAENLLNSGTLTENGFKMLAEALNLANNEMVNPNAANLVSVTESLNAVITQVKASEVIIRETIFFNESRDFYGTEFVQGQYAKVVPAANGNNNPYCNGSYLYWYRDNTLTITSDMPMVDITFDNQYTYNFSCNVGEMVEYNHWQGEAQEIVFTNTYGKTNRISSITITYDNPTNETLVGRIAAQLEITNAALAALTYQVTGRTELEALVADAAALTAESDAAVLKSTLKQLKEQTAAVVALNQAYIDLAALLDVATVNAQQNAYADATILAEAQAKVTEVRAGLEAGAYSMADIQAITEVVNRYASLLAKIYLNITVGSPGELADAIYAKQVELADVAGLRVSGTLNSTDLTTIKGLSNLEELDMLNINITTIPESQFSEMNSLVKVTLPSKTKTIGNSAFNSCRNLQEVILPNTVETIGGYAFYYCNALKNINFPEGLISIGYEAFYCSYDTYYDDNGNYVYRGGSLEEISLPSTLRDIGTYAFAYQTSLKKVAFADGLSRINSYTFYGCAGLADVTWPATLTQIDEQAFYNCDGLTKLELPEGLVTLNSRAFGDCGSLAEVTLPSSLQNLYRPFQYCNSLTKMTSKAIAVPNSNNYNLMGGLESNCTLYVPALSLNMYKEAWNQYGFKEIVGIDIFPENIYIATDYRLNWPADQQLEYRPNVRVAYMGSLTVTSSSVFSAGNFVLEYNGYQARNSSYYDQTLGRYFYNRDNCYGVLLNKAQNVRADKVTVDLTTYAQNWEFMALPFNVKVGDIRVANEGMPFAIRKYDGAKRAAGEMGTTWVNLTNEDVIEAGQGFIIQTPYYNNNNYANVLSFDAQEDAAKNNIFANTDVEVALNEYIPEFEQNRSWNFVGNPYATYFDIRAMVTSAPITIWDNYNGNYQAYSPMDDAYILNPGQAFFVQRPIDEESITFLAAGRQISTEVVENPDYQVNRAPATAERSVFNVTVSGNEKADRTRFVVNSEAKMDYEAGRDASKFMSEEQSVELYTLQNGVRFSINERPLADGIIELGLQIGISGTYTLALDTKVANEIYLIDRLTGDEIRLDGIEGYTFTAEQGTLEGRFALRIGDGELTGIQTVSRGQKDGAEYYDLSGRRIEQPSKGIYISNGRKVVVK